MVLTLIIAMTGMRHTERCTDEQTARQGIIITLVTAIFYWKLDRDPYTYDCYDGNKGVILTFIIAMTEIRE